MKILLILLLTIISLVLEEFKKDALGQLLEVVLLSDNIEVGHRVVDAHALKLHGLVHVAQVKEFNHIVQVYHSHQVLFAQPLQSIKPIFVGRNQDVNCLVRRLEGTIATSKLICINEF